MSKKNSNASNYIKVIILSIALIVIGVSVSYAYYVSKLTGDATQTELKAGHLEIETNLEQEDINAIYNLRMGLIDETEKNQKAENISFYIKSTERTTVNASYKIYLKEIEMTENLFSNYFKWELLQNGVPVGSGNFENLSKTLNTETNLYTTQDLQLNNQKDLILEKDNLSGDSFIFRLWLENDNSVDQIALTNGKFNGRLYLEAVPISNS